jgi:hypothetical protein
MENSEKEPNNKIDKKKLRKIVRIFKNRAIMRKNK